MASRGLSCKVVRKALWVVVTKVTAAGGDRRCSL